MKKTLIVSLFAAVALGICGCASTSDQTTDAASASGTNQPPAKPAKPAKDKRPIEERLTVGMTKDEVIQVAGKPKNTTMNSDGSEIWIYNNNQNAFIPYYTLSGGKFHTVIVTFDTDGKVKSWTTSTTGGY
ncbi:MAG TPA: outer membrane protein assembly factor BamE [Candidatus Aquilonibacter sp.]|nr:outer membrane protein assembly factor BamE [Candidatus Aquilonibacter sp.]